MGTKTKVYCLMVKVGSAHSLFGVSTEYMPLCTKAIEYAEAAYGDSFRITVNNPSGFGTLFGITTANNTVGKILDVYIESIALDDMSKIDWLIGIVRDHNQ